MVVDGGQWKLAKREIECWYESTSTKIRTLKQIAIYPNRWEVIIIPWRFCGNQDLCYARIFMYKNTELVSRDISRKIINID